MNKQRKKRLFTVISILAAASIAASLVVYALGQNINLYFTPAQIAQGEAPENRMIRVGGMVVPGSIQRDKKNLHVVFKITDYHGSLEVSYTGILPALFRERQGVVAEGKLVNGVLMAEQILAKHDEKYMPPEIKKPPSP